jgi:hypothetical protein
MVSIYFLPGPIIPAGQALSNAIDLTTCRILRLIMPAAWTGNAPLTFQLSADNTVFHNLFHVEPYASAEKPSFVPYEVAVSTVVPNSTYALPPSTGDLIPFVRFRSGTAIRPVIQAEDRVFGVVLDISGQAGSAPPGWTTHQTWPPPPAAPAVRAVAQ